MHMPARRAFVAASVAIATLVPGVARADDFAGEWVHPIDTGGEMKLSLRADGTFEFEGMKGTWKGEPGKLTLAENAGNEPVRPEPITYDARIEGDRLTLSGGDLGSPVWFTRKGAKAAADTPRAEPENPAAPATPAKETPVNEAKPDAPDLSRKPQPAPKDAKKWTPRFTGATRVAKTEACEVTLPESWTFQGGEKDGVQYLLVNPGLAATDVLRQQIIFWLRPLKLSEIDQGFKDRVEKGASQADALFNQNGLAMNRQKLQLLDAPGGLMARLDYAGTLSNQFVQGQRATGLCAVVQRKMYDVAVTIVTLEGNEKDATEDALAMLDSTKCFLKDRDQALEQRIVGTWIVPSKTGNTWETYQFFADGTYKWHYESSYTGSIKDSGGNETANWGTASQNDEAGRYEIRGDVIFFVSNKGEQGLHVATGVNAKGAATLTIGSKTFVK